MAQLSALMSAGVVAAGVSAALIAGIDTASADTGSKTRGAAASSADGADRGPRRTDDTAADSGGSDSSNQSDPADADTDTDSADQAEESGDEGAPDGSVDDTDDTADADADDADDAELPDTDSDDAVAPQEPDVTEPAPPSDTAAEPTSAVTEPEQGDGPADTAGEPPAAADDAHIAVPVDSSAAQRVSTALSAPTAVASPPSRTFQDVVQSLMMEIIGAAVRFVSGPPVVPPGSNVTVRSSRLEITEGRSVRADWYYPDAAEPPQRLIYLQHGYLGIGPMYSYTAAWLAERTNSIVVAPTLSSNRYVRDGFWLGDDQVYRATAELLLGDRDALTDSAVAAGFARKYGTDAALPESFMLVGHSLGAGVAAGAAGYYADAVIASGATNRLAGIITLDGAPPADVLPEALDKLDSLGAYIPVLELGAPRDGETRRVDEALNGHRPGHFNGVVLDGGQHLDSMQGGSWLIQYVSYLYQGFPTEQNKSAAQTLIAGWVNDIFAGTIDPSTGACGGDDCDGIYGEPGQAVSVATPQGPATGVVIGVPAAPTSTEFRPLSVSSLVSARSTAVRLTVDV
jgi:pimeloyl-ACP methyl ester carboxylesterase